MGDNIYPIISLDDECNLVCGTIKVVDEANLRLLRDSLLKYHKLNYLGRTSKKCGVGEIPCGLSVSDDRIIHNVDVNYLGDGISEYTQLVCKHKHLGLLNLCNRISLSNIPSTNLLTVSSS